MIVYTDSIDYAARTLPGAVNWDRAPSAFADRNLKILIDNLYHNRPFRRTVIYTPYRWKYLFMVEKAPSSHFDLLVRLGREGVALPDGILCLAGSGGKFHGQHSRPWTGLEGNIHLVVYLTPKRRIDHFDVAFTILSTVSTINAVDAIDGLNGRAAVKWVNDILIDEAKVGGVLTHTQSVEGDVTAVVLGVGLNVKANPEIEPDPYVLRATSLHEHLPNPEKCNLQVIFRHLTRALDENYQLLLENQYSGLLETYRKRSLVIGRRVKIVSDRAEGSKGDIAEGTVSAIGENLELILENHREPINRGRLILNS
jgi:BirA family biotin operon repressor/biotin-[acetyl-CoA-carboxylase] ligase